jgi:hypothetical protein
MLKNMIISWYNKNMTYTEQLEKAESRLVVWEEAEDRIAVSGQSYSFNDGDLKREMTRANLPEVHSMVVMLTNKISRLEKLIRNNGRSGNISHARGV